MATPAVAVAAELWDLSLEELSQIEISSIATGSLTPVTRSASSVSVITREQIEALGATELDQVLETIPGLHITRSPQTYFGKYVFRGIASEYNPEVLLMINDIPVKTLFTGSRDHVWGGLPLKAVQRIEVIRGPGSAVYGADAFAGVINIRTLSGAEITRQEAGVRAGSFDTGGGWTRLSTQLGEAQLGLVAEYEQTDGQQETITADAQTQLDQLLGTQASLAPGPLQLGRKSTDLRLDLASEHWQWRAGYQLRDDMGLAGGIALALDPLGQYRSERFNTDLTYRRDDLVPDWEWEARLHYYHHVQENLAPGQLFPPGSNLGAGVFPDGVLGTPSYLEDQARLDLKGAWSALEQHLVRLGAGVFWGDIYEVTETKNFSGFPPAPLPGGLQDVSDTAEAFLPEEQRTSSYLFLQDEWSITPDSVLSTGVRFDHYSDFGSHLTPRIALVQQWSNTLSTRISYGEAFHAPAFVDLYSSNNPVALGNPDLKPETIDTWEVALHHQPSPQFSYSLTLFRYRIQDAIVYTTMMAENAGRRRGEGGELEASWQLTKQLLLSGNYSHQQAIDTLTDADVGEAPNDEAYVRLTWEPAPDWLATTEALWVGKQKRAWGDPRPDLQDYSTLNIAVTRKQLWRQLDLMVSARNLLDANVREPSPSPAVYYDYPQAGRSLIAEASWHW